MVVVSGAIRKDGLPGRNPMAGKGHGLNVTCARIMAGDTYIRRVRALLKTKGYDPSVVVGLLHRAAEVGNAEALYALGTWHLFGKHVKKDLRVAAQFLERAAGLDHPDAAYDLAVSHEKGAGVGRDKHRAFSLYMKAALLGDRQAKYEVARCFYWGIGTTKDRDAANVWFDAFDRDGQLGRTITKSGIAHGWRTPIAA